MSEPQRSGSPAVRKMFSSIAGRYDFLNRLFSLGMDVRWRRKLAEQVPSRGNAPILDLATGTGDVALTVEETCPGDRLVVGADFTLDMLLRAVRKIHRAGARRVRLTAGDAYRLPFRDGTFGAVTISFGIRNLAHRVDALREMARVLAPGGRVVILEFSPAQKPVLGPLFRFYFHTVMPWFGGIVSGNPGAYRYLPESVQQFPGPEELAEEMKQAGLEGVSFRSLAMGVVYLHTGEKRAGESAINGKIHLRV